LQDRATLLVHQNVIESVYRNYKLDEAVKNTFVQKRVGAFPLGALCALAGNSCLIVCLN
jgi:hypothetical protein